MPISPGFDQLQPKYILGTDRWVSSVAENLVGSQLNPPNQLREHFPFYPFAQSQKLVVPRVNELCTAAFVGNQSSRTDESLSQLTEPAEEIELTSIVGDVSLTGFPIDLQSYSIDQL